MRSKQGLLQRDLELTARQLLAPLGTETVLEIDNVEAIASIDQSRPEPIVSSTVDALNETSEIELTAEQMSAMLEGRWPEKT